nr:MAG TPA: hypothetical protein [Caudoviricetes sp.]
MFTNAIPRNSRGKHINIRFTSTTYFFISTIIR